MKTVTITETFALGDQAVLILKESIRLNTDDLVPGEFSTGSDNWPGLRELMKAGLLWPGGEAYQLTDRGRKVRDQLKIEENGR